MDMINLPRRRLVSLAALAPAGISGTVLSSACSSQTGTGAVDAAAATRHALPVTGMDDPSLGRELVRNATLAPSSHNTQCWKFAVDKRAITILPDPLRRCPAVDPDDHHVFVSLGCATENLAQAALAHGLQALGRFDDKSEVIRVDLAPTRARSSPLFAAIATRQCTRGDYDARPLSGEELALLERAGSSDEVRMMLITAKPDMERVLAFVVQANTVQMADAAFVRELRTWIRFNGPQAVRTGDGLYSPTTGNPTVPTWLGELAFGWLYTPKGENDKVARQIRSSAGIAVFAGEAADKAHWVAVGRCYERFALQATALGIRNAMINQPVEVPSVRPQFAQAMGLAGRRPDLIVRFGRGPVMPSSLRRPVQDVLV